MKMMFVNKVKKSISYLKNNLTLNNIIIGVYIVILLLALISFLIDHMCCVNDLEDYEALKKMYIFFEKVCDFQSNYIIDAVATIWGFIITISLLLVEYKDSHWYGVSLKRIANLTFIKPVRYIAVALYALIFPLIIILSLYKYYCTASWLIACLTGSFILLPVFVLKITSKTCIIKCLGDSTIEQFEILCLQKKDNLQMELEKLPITDMIEHVNYDDIVDVEQLLNTLENLLIKNGMLEMVKNTVYEHVVLMMWTDRIIEKSGIGTYRQCDRTAYILKGFWHKLFADANNAHDSLKMLSCSIEILVPLLKYNTQGAVGVINRVIKILGDNRYYNMIYLLMYLEFIYCYNPMGCNLDLGKDLCHIICVDRKTLIRQCKLWDRTYAVKFWISWCRYRGLYENISLTEFIDFSSDINYLSQNNTDQIKTYVMKSVFFRLEMQ